jgi:hypothetical protein
MKRLALFQLIAFFSAVITPGVSGQRATFSLHPVDLSIPGIHCVKVFDLDLDGDPDIIGGSEHTPWSTSVGLMWWRNDGGNPLQWTKFVIDPGFLHVMSVDVNYLDNDNFPDIVASSWESGKISWWKNSGNPEMGWTSFDIVTGWINQHDATCHDIDSDGDMDVIGAGSGNNRISVFKNQGGTVPAWQEELVTSNFAGAKSVVAEDLDGDSLPDLVAAGDVCDDIAWWKNHGGNPIIWQKKFITTNFTGAGGLDIADMNYDGQPDVLGSAWKGNEVSFWICNDIAANSWTKNLVTDQLDTVSGAIASDIDLDGDMDIVAVAKIPGELVIFFNENGNFEKETLYPAFFGGSALSVSDIDQDGDDDIVAGAGVLQELWWFENHTINVGFGNDIRRKEGIKVCPNPSAGNFTAALPDAAEPVLSVRIMNLAGKSEHPVQFTAKGNLIHILADRQNPGLYFLEIVTKQTTTVAKIVIGKN